MNQTEFEVHMRYLAPWSSSPSFTRRISSAGEMNSPRRSARRASTWSDLVFVQVDLERVEALRSTRDEPIFSAEFISPAELIRRVKLGEDDHGAKYRMCTSNSVWFIFFCCHPELFVA
jgi:hypothetical protein